MISCGKPGEFVIEFDGVKAQLIDGVLSKLNDGGAGEYVEGLVWVTASS